MTDKIPVEFSLFFNSIVIRFEYIDQLINLSQKSVDDKFNINFLF